MIDAGLSDQRGFLALQKRILKERGLDLAEYRDKCLKRRIDVRLRATGARSYVEYITVLKKDPTEYERLLDALTINVTDFFRDMSTYKVIEEMIIPELIAQKKSQRKRIIRIWSAGCASGQEPYSMAILLHKILGERIGEYLVSIYATDIDEKVIRKAEKGEYEAGDVSEVDAKILKRYFDHNLKFSLKEEIRQMVKFMRHNLISDRPPGRLDMIVCRNLLIYFSRALQVKVFDKFCESLNRGGYLVLGKTESLAGESAGLFQPVSIRERIYRKI